MLLGIHPDQKANTQFTSLWTKLVPGTEELFEQALANLAQGVDKDLAHFIHEVMSDEEEFTDSIILKYRDNVVTLYKNDHQWRLGAHHKTRHSRYGLVDMNDFFNDALEQDAEVTFFE